MNNTVQKYRPTADYGWLKVTKETKQTLYNLRFRDDFTVYSDVVFGINPFTRSSKLWNELNHRSGINEYLLRVTTQTNNLTYGI